jgi:hypothetical protein
MAAQVAELWLILQRATTYRALATGRWTAANLGASVWQPYRVCDPPAGDFLPISVDFTLPASGDIEVVLPLR